MAADLADLSAFVAVVRTGGFREGARVSGFSASSLSQAVRRLEAKLGVRLLNRTTRSVAPTEAAARLFERLLPALDEVETAIDVVNAFRDRPTGTLRLNVPGSVARLVLPAIVTPFLKAFPDIRMEVIVEDGFVDVLAAGCDAGIRYDERLEQDMIAVPIGPRVQRFATAASPAYLDARGRPAHPSDLLEHACLRGRFAGGATPPWAFERDGEVLRVDPVGPLTVRLGSAADLKVDAAVAGLGIVHLFEEWLRPHLDSGALEPVLVPWWQSFSGPFLYYPGRRHLPAPLRLRRLHQNVASEKDDGRNSRCSPVFNSRDLDGVFTIEQTQFGSHHQHSEGLIRRYAEIETGSGCPSPPPDPRATGAPFQLLSQSTSSPRGAAPKLATPILRLADQAEIARL